MKLTAQCSFCVLLKMGFNNGFSFGLFEQNSQRRMKLLLITDYKILYVITTISSSNSKSTSTVFDSRV